ncbi:MULTISPECIES: DUF6235 family protein [Amycolatopsis]|uniref:Uncharacterized protein n=1 Tax=Amycolatopsis eburnea TaxID=2267691 RepID=A0A3R9DYR9_9PSEU|nr:MULTISPECIES: DUF6235 family protein [Amycolatopsis]NBH02742.1 hypothetical protein [Amycolatopsis sp. SID8362]NED39444.1 hypothetical protein [Amycolatopsis sp. SID8362]RSD10796.1 hypothetical protein EIY87_39080 [Amycolatopsis eburnea]
MAVRLQLTAGFEILEEWAESATQAQRNALYEALFAVGDGSAFLVYDIFGDAENPRNFVVVVKANLVLKIMVQRAESSFEIRYVGALEDDVDVAPAQSGPANPE